MQQAILMCVNFYNQHFRRAVYLDATTSILKRLRYSRGNGQVQICNTLSTRYEQKACWSGRGRVDIYATWPVDTDTSYVVHQDYEKSINQAVVIYSVNFSLCLQDAYSYK